jgi:hypothetical protein
VVNRVKSFFRVDKKDIKVGVNALILDRIVELAVKVTDMIITRPTGDKPFLVRLQEGLESWSDRRDDPACNNAVLRVSYR